MATTQRQYARIGRDEFESRLGSLVDFQEVRPPGTSEVVYEIDLPADDLSIRIFSTLYRGESRDCGDDAIRLVIWSEEADRWIGGRKKTLRLAGTETNPEGWWGNLRPKIQDLMLNWRDYNQGRCPDCDSWMVKRDGEYGEFLGCTDYPACKHTEDC